MTYIDPRATPKQLGDLSRMLKIDWDEPQRVKESAEFAREMRIALDAAGATKKVVRKNKPEECVIH